MLVKRRLIGAVFLALPTWVSAQSITQSINLEDLIQRALVSHPNIAFASGKLKAAQTDVLASKLQFLPSISASTQRNSVQYDGGSLAGGQIPSTTLTATQPLYGGGLIAGYRKAKANLKASDYAMLESMNQVKMGVITNYSSWLNAYNKIIALEESYQTYKNYVEKINHRFLAGTSSSAEENLAKTRLLQAGNDLLSAKQEEDLALQKLSRDVGEPILRAQLTQKIAKPVPVKSCTDVVDDAVRISPSLHQFELEIEASKQAANQSKEQAFPQVNLQAQRQIGSATTPGWPGFTSLGLVLQYSPGAAGIGNYIASSGAYEKAKASEFQYSAAEMNLKNSVSAECSRYQSAQLRSGEMGQILRLTNDVGQSNDRLYEAGRKNLLELLNNLREKNQIQIAHIENQSALLESSWKLSVYTDESALGQLTTSDD